MRVRDSGGLGGPERAACSTAPHVAPRCRAASGCDAGPGLTRGRVTGPWATRDLSGGCRRESRAGQLDPLYVARGAVGVVGTRTKGEWNRSWSRRSACPRAGPTTSPQPSLSRCGVRPPMPAGASTSIPRHSRPDAGVAPLAGRRAASRRDREPRWMFTDPDGEPIHPHSISQSFERIARRADVRVIRLHDLRHTHGTRSSPPAYPSKSSANGSATPCPSSLSTPTSTWCQKMQADAARCFERLIVGRLLPTGELSEKTR
jgi:hypothetical protein